MFGKKKKDIKKEPEEREIHRHDSAVYTVVQKVFEQFPDGITETNKEDVQRYALNCIYKLNMILFSDEQQEIYLDVLKQVESGKKEEKDESFLIKEESDPITNAEIDKIKEEYGYDDFWVEFPYVESMASESLGLKWKIDSFVCVGRKPKNIPSMLVSHPYIYVTGLFSRISGDTCPRMMKEILTSDVYDKVWHPLFIKLALYREDIKPWRILFDERSDDDYVVGVYRREDGTFSVYLNQDAGQRQVVLCTTDEAAAVQKLVDLTENILGRYIE